ncbi:MAG: DMT family transporter [Verrucomicrobia bacterium]|jgi:drug/metabolite transporter (DMT)-like permease|nr:DMT family transporter [Verrucomicrobiota bacterium]
MKPTNLIILLALNVVWSATLSIYKVLEPHLDPGGIVTLRFGLAGLGLLVLWPWLPGSAPRGRDLLKTCVLGLVIFVLGHRLQVLGNKLSTASNSSILMAIEPLITSAAAAIFLREHIGPRRILGFALGMTGVALLNGVWRDDFKWVSLSASVIFVSSFVCETALSIGGKPIIMRASPIKFLAVALVAATTANLLLDGRQTLTAAVHLPAQAWWLLLVMALIGTSFGYGFWFLVIRESEVNVAALTIFLQPVCGVLIAKLWLGEPLHWGQLWGSLAIGVGLLAGLSRQIKIPAEVKR